MASNSYHGTVCKTCRRRGKKCDKLLPVCSTCTDKGIVCEGYTFRWAGVASRGKLAGKRAPVVDSPSVETKKGRTRRVGKVVTTSPTHEPPEVQSYDLDVVNLPDSRQNDETSVIGVQGIEDADEPVQFDIGLSLLETDDFREPAQPDFMSTGIEDLDLSLNLFGPQQFLNSRQALASQPPAFDFQSSFLPRSLAPLNLPPDISFILEYYATESAPRLSVDIGSSRNPYMEYILPLAIHVPSLLYACAALASCQFDIRFCEEDYRLRSLRFRGKAMKRLQESLYSEERAKEDGTLATVLMLALCDIALGGFAGFDTHFLGARKLIDLRGDQRTPDGFVEQYLAWLDTMSAASHHRLPVFTANEIARFTSTSSPNSPSGSRAWSFDVFPCPIEYFDLIHRILSLYKSQPDPFHPTTTTLSLVSQFKTQILTRPMDLSRGEPWLHLAEAYRFGIVLYLLRLFQCGNDSDSDGDEIAWLAGSVFYHAQATVPSTGWADQLLWPLFHAALEIRDEPRKDWLRERARSMQISGGFRNVESAMNLLEGVWNGTSPRNYMDLVTGFGEGSMMFV